MYQFSKVEKKWQKKWKEAGVYNAKNAIKGKENFYHLVMFPYPSGDLHMGHWYNFAPADVYARFKRMGGYNVMSPIGFDAFGLPAENAAIKRQIHPKTWTMKNIKTMTKQLESMGNSYDWSRLVITCLPEYYRWNQWIFLQLYKRGLAYRSKAPANWCLSCKTVLANEQVVDGLCERCGSEVIQKEIEQWLFKITKYTERLLKDLERLDWPEKTKTMQRNWIGRSEGALIKFPVKNSSEHIEVFTTRPDTIFGVTYMVLAPEHPLIHRLEPSIKNLSELKRYVSESSGKSERERTVGGKKKTGVELKGVYAINPATQKPIPVWVSDYVLVSYGTGAIMAVPAHDERDMEFAKAFKLPASDAPLVSKDKVIKQVGGKKTVNYKLRDWLISRQRYWGTPIPIIHCLACGPQPVDEKELPILLPPLKDFKPSEDGRSPLARNKKFLKVTCAKCGGSAERETDTMDTFVDSSWYFLRYADSQNRRGAFATAKVKKWLPVDMYVGGAEHTVLHLLYSRFFTKFLYDEGHLDFDEPFTALRHQGIILGPDGQKMSKSRGNVVNPDKFVKNFGADAVRMYLCFMGPYDQGGPWNPTGILGIKRFLERVWNLQGKVNSAMRNPENANLKVILNKTIKKVTEDIEGLRFNTAVSALMILVNELERDTMVPRSYYSTLLLLLGPFAPHATEELWQAIHASGQHRSIHQEQWPQYDPNFVQEEGFELIVQVNGRVRSKIMVARGISEEKAAEVALRDDRVQQFVAHKEVRKVIFVPDRLINIVV